MNLRSMLHLLESPTKPSQKEIEDFADDMNTLARRAPASAKVGPRKVFLSTVCDVKEDAVLLHAAMRQGLIWLARADLVQAMDYELVDASEFRIPGATYHFIEIK